MPWVTPVAEEATHIDLFGYVANSVALAIG